MAIQFSPFESYFDRDGRPTSIGQQLLARLDGVFAQQEADLAVTNADLAETDAALAVTSATLSGAVADIVDLDADLVTLDGTVTTLDGAVTALTATVATKAPLAGPAFTAPPVLPSYTVAGVPSAAASARGLVYVSNETGGAVVAFSDGTNWRRVTDRAIIS